MPQPSADPSDAVPRDPSEPFLLAFVRARRRGDRDAMKRAWEDLLLQEWDRVRYLVGLQRDPSLDGGRLTPDEVDDVSQQVWARLFTWLKLEGSSLGELRKIIRNQVEWAFADHVRAHVRHDSRRAGSLDEVGPDGDTQAAFVRRVEDELADRLLDPLDRSELGRAMVEAVDGLQDRRGEVVGLRLRGYSAKEVAAKLGLEPANVDQLHSRGMRDLRAALKDYR